MNSEYINITPDNLEEEHLCCAIADKKHQAGVSNKKSWLKERLSEGHVFRKLNAKGKVFIEYAPLETAWVPVVGDNYMYIYCFWVSGSYKGKGHAKALLQYCIDDAKSQGKSGICVLSAKKKKPFLSDPKFLKKFGFEVVDQIDDYELLALTFDKNASTQSGDAGEAPAEITPKFAESAKTQRIDSDDLTIYYSTQCPYVNNCIDQVEGYCQDADIELNLIEVDSLDKAKNVPSIFNNWAIFKDGEFVTNHLVNEGFFKKMILNK